MDKTGIGNRIRENYEHRTRQSLPRRTNTIIRLDGKSFHTYTKGLDKPFDEGLIEDMQQTAIYLCENIQGAKCAFTQSDEITLLLTDYDTITTDAWFDGNVQKITSISASMATAKFNQLRLRRKTNKLDGGTTLFPIEIPYLMDGELATFDSRAFTIADKEEVVNNFIWRQQDAERNSIQMLAQSLYSHNELHKKNTSMLQDMCFDKGHNWNDLHFSKKRGSLILNNTYIDNRIVDGDNIEFYRNGYGSFKEPCYMERYQEFYEAESGINKWNYRLIKDPKIRTKWEVVDTPIFTKYRDIIKNLMPII